MRRYNVFFFSSSDEVFPIMEYTGTLGECRYPTGRGMHTINSACEFDGPGRVLVNIPRVLLPTSNIQHLFLYGLACVLPGFQSLAFSLFMTFIQRR